ncbi:MAG: hypothetical protein ACXU82_07815 [Caulobacteraceae bacterium]
MANPRPDSHEFSRLRPAVRAFILFATAVALAVLVSLVWTGVAHPQAAVRLFFGEEAMGARLAIRRLTAWLLAAGCGLIFVGGSLLLALDIRASRQSPGRKS